MLTGDDIVDVDFVVFWRISNAPDFLFNIQNPEGTVKDVAESAMREIVSQSDIQPILTEARAKTEFDAQQLMQRILDSTAPACRSPRCSYKRSIPAQVIDAFRDVQAARADQERLQNEAQAYANRIVPEAKGEAERILQAAQGYRDQVIAEAKGEADRFISVYEQYRGARSDAQAHLHRHHGEGVGRHRQGHHRRQGRTGRRTLSATAGILQAARATEASRNEPPATISLVLLALAAFVGYLTLFTVDHFNCARAKAPGLGTSRARSTTTSPTRKKKMAKRTNSTRTSPSELAAVGHGENTGSRSRKRTSDDA